jgi:hypothetical protein
VPAIVVTASFETTAVKAVTISLIMKKKENFKVKTTNFEEFFLLT